MLEMSSKLICFILQIFILKVTPVHQQSYAPRPYYSREARPMPREVVPYFVDPRYMTSYVNEPVYPKYAAPEPPNPMYRYETPVQIVYPEIQPKPTLVSTPVIEVPPIPPKLPITESHRPRIGGVDPDVLNNLAIALQLLIINNFMNNPISESQDLIQSKNIIADVKNHALHEYEYPAYAMPSSKFLGSNSFGDDGIASMADYGHNTPLSPRVNMMLMSPYDAIARSSSPDPLPAKRDFQNPYSTIIAADYNKDLFSMTDLF